MWASWLLGASALGVGEVSGTFVHALGGESVVCSGGTTGRMRQRGAKRLRQPAVHGAACAPFRGLPEVIKI